MENKEGKINLKFVVSGLFFTMILLWMVNAMNVDIFSPPTNYTFNASRNINITFNVSTQADTELLYNCSFWTNDTAAWRRASFNNSESQSVIQNGSADGWQGRRRKECRGGKDARANPSCGAGVGKVLVPQWLLWQFWNA